MTKDSRLEKFLKALCSLDHSDLPTPLSRVEVLWNCLITGEATPDFQPQSRTEKYLMTILGVYDLEDIPKPFSRAETLLYKLATGDTDVELEDGAKSRYELLLSEIAANGGVGDNVDFEYVTYILTESLNTLYNTVNKPVKSAILKGQTLVNAHIPKHIENSAKSVVIEEQWQVLTTKVSSYNLLGYPCDLYKTNTKYLVIVDVKENTLATKWNGFSGNARCITNEAPTSLAYAPGETGRKMSVITTKQSFDEVSMGVRCNTQTDEPDGNMLKFRHMVIEYQDGMENWGIPYFEGMSSVKMPGLTTTGKNMFDLGNSGMTDEGKYDKSLNGYGYWAYKIKLSSNTTYTVSRKNTDGYGLGLVLRICNEYSYMNASYFIANHAQNENRQSITLTTNNTGYIYFFFSNNIDKIHKIINICDYIQVEESSSATPFEKFKSNILSTSEDVELRGIGDVRDELDLLTGELTQRICDVVLDGSEDWVGEDERFRLYKDNTIPNKWSNGISNHFIGNRGQLMSAVGYDNYFAINGYGSYLYVRDINLFPNPKSQLNEFKSWLSERNAQGNPVVLQYCLSQASIKTVDLSTLDQDGKETKLKTFNDITHVSLSSEGLIPEVELTVYTKNLDDISQSSTMSLRMNDISDRQNELQNEVDTQSESIDSTMMATTEIYEQTL